MATRPQTEVQKIMAECKKRGVDSSLYTVNVYAGNPDHGFLEKKRKARKQAPDLARRWDARFEEGKDPNAEYYDNYCNRMNFGMPFFIIALIGFIVFCLAEEGVIYKSEWKAYKKKNHTNYHYVRVIDKD